MDWHGLIHSLCEGNTAADLVDFPALELVVGNTTFVLEHDPERDVICGQSVLARLPNNEHLDEASLLSLLKDNMELHSAGMGSICLDTLDWDIIWKHEWKLQALQFESLSDTLLHIDELRSDYASRPDLSRPQINLQQQDNKTDVILELLSA